MMIAAPELARAAWRCPVARLWGQKEVDAQCRGDACPLWRWVPLSANDADLKAAIAARLKDIGGGPLKHKDAVAWVMDHREDLGLPLAPSEGFCGLGGKP